MKKSLIFLVSLFPVLLFSYITVSGDVSGQSWTNQTYYVSGNIYVNDDATLSIASGAVIKFAFGTEFSVNGTLDVNGSSGNYVIFTSMHDNTYGEIITGSTGTPSPGDWQGIYLYGFLYRDGIGEFDYCRVRYGGDVSGTADANVRFNSSDSGHFINSFCEYSSQHGIRASLCPVEISNSSFENCIYPAYLSNVTIKTYPNNSATGNVINAFVISGGCVTENMTWTETSTSVITYLIGTSTINDDIVCTITEGTIIKFSNSGQFSVIGTLDVNGTETNPVVITSLQDDSYGGDTNNDGTATSPAPGDWRGIRLWGHSTDDGIGEFDYCRVRYGGNVDGQADANVYFGYSDSGHFFNSYCEYSSQHGLRSDSCPVEISNSSFENNDDAGIFASGGELQINNNQFNNNGNYAAYLNNVNVKNYTNNTGSGNFIEAFGISGTVAEDVTLGESVTGFPFVSIGTMTVNTGYMLTIPEGEVVKFTNYGEFMVNGTLDVNGTETNPVILTSLKDDNYGGDTNNDGTATSPAPGDWKGIRLYGSSSEGIGEFDHCRVRYGGSSANIYANVYFYQSDSGHFLNSYCEYSSQYGLRAYDCPVEISNSSFENNDDYAAYLHIATIKQYPNNFATGNGVDAFGIDGTILENMTWTETTSSVITSLLGTVTINDNIVCTIPAGTIIKSNNDGQFSVYGTLDVNGTETNPVIFTSLQDDTGGDTNNDGAATSPAPGDWKGIYLDGSSGNQGIGEFSYCFVKYAGNSSGDADANVYFNQSNSGSFEYSICEYSSLHGLKALDSPVYIDNSDFDNNGDDGINAHYNEIWINNSNFNNNGDYAVHLQNVSIKPYPNNSATGNGYDVFGINGFIAEDMNWEDIFPSVNAALTGPVTINNGVALTIPEGKVIKLNNAGQLIVNGTLYVNGTEAYPVVFTSFQDDTFGGDTNNDGDATSPAPGDWYGIHLNGSSGNQGIGEFDYCRIRYGGNVSGNADANVYFDESDTGYLVDSYIEYSSQSGVSLYETLPIIRRCTFEDNTSYGVYISGNSNPDFGTITDMGLNTFINNDSGNYQFYNDTANDINAYYNIWEYTIADSIDAHIYDDDEDPAKGEVLFDPWFGTYLYPPQNVTISISSDSVYVSWDPVIDATSYTVYSDTDPYGTFTTNEWTGTATNWSESVSSKKFYRVTAHN